MFKSTSKAEQFYARSGSESTKGSRKGYSLLDEGVNPTAVLSEVELAMNEQIALKARLSKLNEENAAYTDTVMLHEGVKNQEFHGAVRARHKVRQQIREITLRQQELNKIIKPAGKVHDMAQIFMDVCKETMPRAQFMLLVQKAYQRAEERKA